MTGESRLRGLAGKFFQAETKYRVEIAKKNDRDLGTGAKLAQQTKNSRQRDRLFERAFGSALDGRPVGGWIGKWDAQLDAIGAALLKRPHDL